MKKWWRRWLLLLLAASPAVAPLVMIGTYSVNTPFADELDPGFSGLLVKAHRHQLSIDDFLAPHNEHRPALTKFTLLAIGWLTNWNVICEMVCAWVVVALTSAGILWLHHMNMSPESAAPPGVRGGAGPPVFLRSDSLLLWFLANLLIFSPREWEIWLWGIGIVNIMPMFFVVAALLAARSSLSMRTRTIAVILLSIAATYCVASGILCWGLAGAVLLWSASRKELKRKRWFAAALVGAFVLVMSLYLIGMTGPGHAPVNGHEGNIFVILSYLVYFAGSIYFRCTAYSGLVNAGFTGAVMLLLLAGCAGYFLFLWRRRHDMQRCRQMLPWFAVAGYGVLAGIMTGIGRGGMGPEAPFASRYVAFGIYLPVGLIFLIRLIGDDLAGAYRCRAPVARGATAHTVDRPAALRAFGILQTVLTTLLIAGWVLGFPEQLYAVRLWYDDRRLGRASLLLFNILPDNPLIPKLVFPIPVALKSLIPALNEIGLLHPPLIESPNVALLKPSVITDASFSGAIERFWKSSDTELTLYGWATLPIQHRPADAILLCYDNSRGEPIIFSVGPIDVPRDDRAKAMNDPALAKCGWAFEYPLAALPPEPKSLTISVWALDSEHAKAYPMTGSTTVNR